MRTTIISVLSTFILVFFVHSLPCFAQMKNERPHGQMARVQSAPRLLAGGLHPETSLRQSERARSMGHRQKIKRGTVSRVPSDSVFIVTSYTWERWDTTSKTWWNALSVMYTYDGDDRLIEVLKGEWDGSAWAYSMKYTYAYDSAGHLREYETQTRFHGVWENDKKDLFTYDATGNLAEDLCVLWEGGTWTPLQRYTYSYDSLGHVLGWVFSLRGHGQDTVLHDLYRSTIAYNSFGLQTDSLHQDWNGSSWVTRCVWKTSYNSNLQIAEQLVQVWFDSVIIDNIRSTWIYDNNGNQTERLNEVWEESTWVKIDKEMYAYNADGNLTGWLYERWEDSTWLNNWQDIYTYDGNGCVREDLYQSWVQGVWKDANRYTYTWRGLFVGMLDQTQPGLTYQLFGNYPNPFNPTTEIKFSLAKSGNVKLTVLDILGRTVATLVDEKREAGLHTVRWDASGVATGIYFYQIRAGNFVEVRKMVLLR